jgi:hypothetical protein
MTTFVDSHCHLFNITDVPLYEALRGKIKMGTLAKFFSLMAGGAAVLTNSDEKLIKRHRNFIRFFEREQKDNLVWFAGQLREAVKAKQPAADLIVITPLIMDFDQVRDKTDIGDDVSVTRQYERLRQAIKDAGVTLDQAIPVKVFPFMGFDMGKLLVKESSALNDLKAFWAQNAASPQERLAGYAAIPSGKVLGLKLYPPLGFNPFPNDKTEEAAYLPFYNWCVEQNIPITVHCQPGSFTGMKSEREMRSNTDSANWLKLFKKYTGLRNLRINFAHFGGETELTEALKGAWEAEYSHFNADRINPETWVGRLVHLLKNYPNTYADLSAFEFADETARQELSKLLDWEARGNRTGIQGEHALSAKLLWGSDVPMIISADTYLREKYRNEDTPLGYQYLFGHFLNMVQETKALDGETNKQRFVADLTQNNPSRFMLLPMSDDRAGL